jgi:hypothetical protein
MAFNGSGIFNRLYNWVQDAANGIAITASRMDAEDQGFADGLSNCITKDGQSSPSADIPFNNKKITGSGGVASSPATDLPFYVGASQYARITAAGRTVLGGGAEATSGANAAGLQLPAAATSGIYLGNTVNSGANVLDWTEKNGTFTPAIVGGATNYISRSGYYTRVANVVYFELIINWTTSTAGSPFYINGLPYTAISTASDTYPVYSSFQNFTAGTFLTGKLYYNAGSPQISIEEITNGFSANPATVSTGGLTKQIIIAGKYRV